MSIISTLTERQKDLLLDCWLTGLIMGANSLEEYYAMQEDLLLSPHINSHERWAKNREIVSDLQDAITIIMPSAGPQYSHISTKEEAMALITAYYNRAPNPKVDTEGDQDAKDI